MAETGKHRIEAADPGRRAFLKTFVGAAFVVPVVASFALDGIVQSASASSPIKMNFPNQSFPNQTFPNQCFPNQAPPAQDWSGVLGPVLRNGKSVFKRGDTIPVKWLYVGQDFGLRTPARFSYYQESNQISGNANSPGTNAPPTSGSYFQYDPVTHEYVYNWSTEGLGRGTYIIEIEFGYCGWFASIPVSLR